MKVCSYFSYISYCYLKCNDLRTTILDKFIQVDMTTKLNAYKTKIL